MKKLNDYINEALNTLPKEFANIWKGKSTNIDIEYMENPALLAQSIMDVHRRNLPTEEEFINLCEWMIKNIDSDKTASVILDTMYETFGVSYGIKPAWDWDLKKVYGGVHTSNRDDITYTFFFLIYKFIERYKDKDDALNTASESFEKVLKKWNITLEKWPDYSGGIEMLSKKFHK